MSRLIGNLALFTLILASACGKSSTSSTNPLTATGGNGQVSLTWGAVTGATGYNVYYSTSKLPNGLTSSNYSQNTGVYTTSSTTNWYTVTGLSAGATYYFVVTAVTNGSESTQSGQVSATTLSASSGFQISSVTATRASATSVLVSWTAVSGATSYTIYWSIGSSVNIASPTGSYTATSGTSYTVTGLATGSQYSFVVYATGTGNTASATP